MLEVQDEAVQSGLNVMRSAVDNATTEEVRRQAAKAQAEAFVYALSTIPVLLFGVLIGRSNLKEYLRSMLVELKIKHRREEEGRHTFYFVKAQQLRLLGKLRGKGHTWPPKIFFRKPATWHQLGLPNHQVIRSCSSLLVPQEIVLSEGFRGKYEKKFLIISHRWITPSSPDPEAAQLEIIIKYLQENPNIEYVWYDFWCLPQKPRSIEEDVLFRTTLDKIYMLFLTCSVVVVLDLQYLGRFWTCYETWLSLHTASAQGLVHTRECDRRVAFRCTEGAEASSDHYTKALVNTWSAKTVEQAKAVLAKADILVTNQRDKEQQLQVLDDLDRNVKKLYSQCEYESALSEPPSPERPTCKAAMELELCPSRTEEHSDA